MAPLEKSHETMAEAGPANPLSETADSKDSLASKKADGDSENGAFYLLFGHHCDFIAIMDIIWIWVWF